MRWIKFLGFKVSRFQDETLKPDRPRQCHFLSRQGVALALVSTGSTQRLGRSNGPHIDAQATQRSFCNIKKINDLY